MKKQSSADVDRAKTWHVSPPWGDYRKRQWCPPSKRQPISVPPLVSIQLEQRCCCCCYNFNEGGADLLWRERRDSVISGYQRQREGEKERLGLCPCPVKRPKKKRKKARGGQQVEETEIVTENKKHLLKKQRCFSAVLFVFSSCSFLGWVPASWLASSRASVSR